MLWRIAYHSVFKYIYSKIHLIFTVCRLNVYVLFLFKQVVNSTANDMHTDDPGGHSNQHLQQREEPETETETKWVLSVSYSLRQLSAVVAGWISVDRVANVVLQLLVKFFLALFRRCCFLRKRKKKKTRRSWLLSMRKRPRTSQIQPNGPPPRAAPRPMTSQRRPWAALSSPTVCYASAVVAAVDSNSLHCVQHDLTVTSPVAPRWCVHVDDLLMYATAQQCICDTNLVH